MLEKAPARSTIKYFYYYKSAKIYGEYISKLNSKGKQYKSFTYRNFKNLDHAKLIKDLEEAPWDTAFTFDDVEDIVSGWYSLLNNVINAHVPLKQKRVGRE